ncbi:STAS domain-containing protein [Streptomyces vinaceus]|nr:STAS domain-containing protein [Streptomyces vinaceus]
MTLPMSSGGPGSHPCVEITRLVLPGPAPTRRDAALLCARLTQLYEDGADAVECDVGAVTAPDLALVEALARLRLAARGRPLRVVGASPALRALLGLVGLLQLLGEAEEGEPAGGVQEGVQSGDPPV